MKKILLAMMALATLLSFSACNKELLNTNPTDSVSGDTMFNDTEGAMMALNGTFRYMWRWGATTTGNYHQCFGPQSYNLMADLMGEDMVMAASGNGWFWFDYIYDVKDAFNNTTWRPYDAWNYYYTLISNANYIIDAAEKIAGQPDEINYIVGNAYAIRAYAYAYAAMLYARSYIGHEDRLSVPIYTEPTFAGTVGKARSTNREVFKQAISDIDKAITLIGETSRKHVTHFNKYVANGVKARIALYMGDYQAAHDAAVIAVKGGSYAYDSAFHYNDASHKSVLWGAEIIEAQGTTNPQFLAHMDIAFGGYGKAARKCCSAWLYAKMGANDKRATDWWKYEVLEDGKTKGYQQYKFLFKDAKSPMTGADHIFMRAAEMQLIIAETACRLGKEDEAITALNELMKTRDVNYDCSGLTGTSLGALTTDETGSLLEEILIQRRIELWGEFGRVYDIKRLRQGFVRTKEMGHPIDGLLNKLHCDDPETFDWVMTIPAKEYNANPLILQNPVGSYPTSDLEGDDPAKAPKPAASEE
ncbi:MAG: RagB/SusD family nutrient uptake outer membrane protein [Bacteroidales bacterium]|nr:RagB/SusD family nutrient uptake outer membrane protein [Bacteroidales bacterium]